MSAQASSSEGEADSPSKRKPQLGTEIPFESLLKKQNVGSIELKQEPATQPDPEDEIMEPTQTPPQVILSQQPADVSMAAAPTDPAL